jgi:hypothetical protein
VAGQVYVTKRQPTRTPSRRVLMVNGGRVCYSAGGDVTRWCSLRCFRLWMRRYAALQTRTRRARSLALAREAAG